MNGGEIFRDEAKTGECLLLNLVICSKDFTVDKSLDEILKQRMKMKRTEVWKVDLVVVGSFIGHRMHQDLARCG